MNRQRGFGAVEIVLVVVFVSLIGFLGWRLWEAQQDIDSLKKQSQSKAESTKESENENSSKSDEQLVAEVVCGGTSQKAIDYAVQNVNIYSEIFATYGGGCYEPDEEDAIGGGIAFLKKKDGSWVFIFWYLV